MGDTASASKNTWAVHTDHVLLRASGGCARERGVGSDSSWSGSVQLPAGSSQCARRTATSKRAGRLFTRPVSLISIDGRRCFLPRRCRNKQSRRPRQERRRQRPATQARPAAVGASAPWHRRRRRATPQRHGGTGSAPFAGPRPSSKHQVVAVPERHRSVAFWRCAGPAGV